MAVGYLDLEATDSYLEAADTASLDITGDITLLACIRQNAYPPLEPRYILSKYDGGARAYALYIDNTDGDIGFTWHDGTTSNFIPSSGSLPGEGVTTEDDVWVMAEMDIDDGAGSYLLRFYFSHDPADTPVGDVTWTQLGIDRTGTATAIAATNSPLWVGRFHDNDTATFDGRIYVGEIHSGLLIRGGQPTRVANPDFRNDAQGWSSPPGVDDHSHSYSFFNATWVPPADRLLGRNVHYDFLNKKVLIESGV